MTGGPSRWTGCHGAQLLGDASIQIGACTGDPLAEVHVEVGEVGELEGRGGAELWSLDAEVETRSGRVIAHQRLMRMPDGDLVMRTNRGAALRAHLEPEELTVQGPDAGTIAQLVASYGIPLVLARRDVLFVHGSACARGDRSVVVVGPSGSGKSSLLVRLVENGWNAVTEDVCALDLRGRLPAAWPGPPWVRRLRGEPGPLGSAPRFETEDKIVWDTAPCHASAATPVGVVVVLEAGCERPAGPDVMARGEAFREIASNSVWLGAPEDRSRALFERVARVSAAVTVVRLSLPRSPSWLDGVTRIFEELLA